MLLLAEHFSLTLLFLLAHKNGRTTLSNCLNHDFVRKRGRHWETKTGIFPRHSFLQFVMTCRSSFTLFNRFSSLFLYNYILYSTIDWVQNGFLTLFDKPAEKKRWKLCQIVWLAAMFPYELNFKYHLMEKCIRPVSVIWLDPFAQWLL